MANGRRRSSGGDDRLRAGGRCGRRSLADSGARRTLGAIARPRGFGECAARKKRSETHGTPGQRNALLKGLIVEVRLERRDSIIATFRLPATPVHITEAMVDRSSYNANRALTLAGCLIAV